jgi:hypothetical protein
MRVDPADLESVGRAIGRCADDLMTGLQQLERTVTSNSPWGADEPGSLFGMAYTEVLGHAMDVYGSHVQQLADAAQRLSAWATTTAQVDAGNAQVFDAIQAQVGA